MMKFMAGLEISIVDVCADYPICIPKWHTTQYQFVDLFHTKKVVKLSVIQNVFSDLYPFQRIDHDRQTFFDTINRREKDVLAELLISVIA